MIKTMYQTSDGLLFEETEKDKAQQHETELEKSVYMFYADGTRTDNIEHAVLVYLPLHYSASKFIEIAEINGNSYQGIDENSTGWFLWNNWESCYDHISDNHIQGLLRAVRYVASVGENIVLTKDAEKSTKKLDSFAF